MTLGRVINRIKKNEFLYSFLGIAFFVSIFNYEAVLGLDVLLLDDNARFSSAIRGVTFNDYWLNFGWITALIKALNLKLMLIGITFARVFYLVVFVIPLSMSIFYFNRKLLNFDSVPAFISAIIINILPLQLHVPKFLDGSGFVIGMLFLFLSLIFALKYLKTKNLLNLALSGFLWHTANQSLGELGVIMFPALILLFVLYESPFKNKLIILAVYVPIVLYKFYRIISFDRGAAGKAVLQTFDTVIYRAKKAVEWGSVFNLKNDFTLYATGFLLFCFVVGFLFALYKRKGTSQRQEYLHFLFYFLFGLLSIAPFILLTKYFSTRYFYTSFAAFWILTILSVYYILLNVIKRKLIVFMLLICLIIFSGVHRHLNQIKENRGFNNRNATICGAIQELEEIKPDGQVVITGIANGTGEYYMWSMGYIDHCLQRGDVVGLIGNEYSFYDPFNTNHRGYAYKMEGLDIEKPIYVVKRMGAEITNNPKYYLRWFDSKDKKSDWIVYTRNSQTAILNEYYSGSGFDNYLNEAGERSIATSDIFWGNYLSKYTKKGF